MAFLRTDEVTSSSGTGKTHKYLRIVESVREKGKVRQKIIANLGNIAVLSFKKGHQTDCKWTFEGMWREAFNLCRGRTINWHKGIWCYPQRHK
jgi:hypothetical protein